MGDAQQHWLRNPTTEPLPRGWKIEHKLEPPDRLARRQRNKLRKIRIHRRRKHGRP